MFSTERYFLTGIVTCLNQDFHKINKMDQDLILRKIAKQDHLLYSELLALLVSLLSSDGLAPSDLDWLTIRSSGLVPTDLSGIAD